MIEKGLYRGESWDLGFRALFGGQVLAQSLTAASRTVDNARFCNSFHSYFLLPGDASKPVVYDVENVRDGRSFSTRRVKAIQNGKNIFYMTASFQTVENGLVHQYANMPEVPAPHDLVSDITHYEKNKHKLSAKMQEVLAYHKPIDFRSVKAVEGDVQQEQAPVRHIWLKANEKLGQDIALNQAALAYASDYHFLTTALMPHGIHPSDKELAIATIDHAMWFHRPIQFDEWLLYVIDAPSTGNARGFVRGEFFDREGNLVASAAQEGLLRLRKNKN
ncbi:acyl-CoA thioesterase II [Alteromonas sediminis]|uniref:Acyl-CoA thioesterase 2 n=1 Tax=Alteromonas sediminis TaxID=2259342 RepID=A0A3N5ZCM1_9ALTE|nr:acyl-CoA thioesterase II [Alteromonas sediminis]RPJ67668.1 acyl-CoA thioesterase II [Alteromonas sediminis]